VTPPLEEVLYSPRITRSKTARVRKANNLSFQNTPRRAGLTALTYKGRQELPVFQDVAGGPGERVKHRPNEYRGQGIRKVSSGDNYWYRRNGRKEVVVYDRVEAVGGEEGENYEEDEDMNTSDDGEGDRNDGEGDEDDGQDGGDDDDSYDDEDEDMVDF